MNEHDSTGRLLGRRARRAALAIVTTASLLVGGWAAGGVGAISSAVGAAGVHRASAAVPRPGSFVVAMHGRQIVVQPRGRFGLIPTMGHRLAAAAAQGGPLFFGGGNAGIGVTIGHPQVFMVFWGSQWGANSTDQAGDTTFSNDPSAAAPFLQGFFKGLGTNNELWSGVMTQYCEGVAKGATTCPAGAAHIGYPTGGALAGVFVDTAQAAPQQASEQQMAAETVVAAQHFGNTTAASNRSAQYVLVFPTGTNPGGFNAGGGFCAFHSATGSQFGELAFTNMPYVSDAGGSCGQNLVNPGAAGVRDGFGLATSHEYAETITDQVPGGGWVAADGEENGDLCAFLTNGPGRAQNIALSTGSFPVQSTFSNDDGACAISHPIVT